MIYLGDLVCFVRAIMTLATEQRFEASQSGVMPPHSKAFTLSPKQVQRA